MTNWLIRVDGIEMEAYDLPVTYVGDIEKASGTSWGIANPLAEYSVARAYLAAVMLHHGRSDEDVELFLKTTMKAGHLATAFTYLKDEWDEETDEEPDPSPPSPSRTSRSSSPMGRGSTTGPPTSPEPSG